MKSLIWPAWILALVALALRLAEPTHDGDIFWHLAYADQMLANGSPFVDHGKFSWLHQDIPEIYCAWFGQLMLRAVYSLAGFEGVFWLRYLVFALCLGQLLLFLGKKQALEPLMLLALTLWGLASYHAFIEKPQLFSLLFFNLTILLTLWERNGSISATKFMAGTFLLMTIWVNTHGAFLFGLVFLVAQEFEIRLLAEPKRLLRPLAWLLTTTLTPYGISYPLSIVKSYLTPEAHSMHTKQVSEWLGIFDPAMAPLHLPALFALCVVAIGWSQVQLWKAGRPTSLSIPNLLFILLALLYARAFIFLPTLAVYSFFFALKIRNESCHRSPRGPAYAALLILCLGMTYQWHARPTGYLWPGSGVENFTNPVDEAGFIAGLAGRTGKLYNSYNGGGYLLWKLYPNWKVMVDARAFPYTSYFEEIWPFLGGQEVATFVEKYPADIAVIPHENPDCLSAFIRMQWKEVYIGPSAVVFTLDPTIEAQQTLEELQRLPQRVRNRLAAMYLAQTFLNFGQLELAQSALDRAAELPGRPAPEFDGLPTYIAAERARLAGNLDAAIELHERCFSLGGHKDIATLQSLYRAKIEASSASEREAWLARFQYLENHGAPASN